MTKIKKSRLLYLQHQFNKKFINIKIIESYEDIINLFEQLNINDDYENVVMHNLRSIIIIYHEILLLEKKQKKTE